MNKLRVLLYPQYSTHAHGGPSTVAYHLSTELKKHVEVSYYPSFQYSIQQIPFRDYATQLLGVCEKACKRHFDIQHFIMLPTLFNGSYPFAWLSKIGGLPLIINIHGILHLEHTFWEKNYFDKARILSMKSSTLFLCKKASRLVVNSEFSYKNLIDWYGIEPEKVVIIPNGINLNMFQSIPNSSKNLVLEGDPTILFVGSHFSYSKGVDTLIKAIAIAKRDFPNIRLHVVGSSGNVLPELKSLILKEGIENNIYFHGWISQEELHQYYNAADFCIFSSILETLEL